MADKLWNGERNGFLYIFRHRCLLVPVRISPAALDRRGGQAMSKKTRSQQQREREQAIFIAVASAGIVALVAVILWKAVT